METKLGMGEMKVVFTDKLSQFKDNPNDDQPHLIDGEYYEWIIRSSMLKLGESFREWLDRMKVDMMENDWHKERGSFGIVVYDVRPIEGVPVSEKDSEYYGQGAIFVRWAWLQKNKQWQVN